MCSGYNEAMFVRGLLYVLAFLSSLVVVAKIRSRRPRQAALLIASYTFYVTWGAWIAAVLVTSTLVNFRLGEWLRRKPSPAALATGIFLNLALLGTFKYLPAIAIIVPLASVQQFASLALPLGISFWTFQAISYLFDLYRGEELDPSLLEFALYMAFFPVTISGPICRMPEMLPQFRAVEAPGGENVGHGLRRIATGVFMMTLARLLGQGVLAGDGINSGFDHANRWSGTDVWCLALGYGLQLFFDFAGYSHIAIGSAQTLGFTLPENFSHPFQSTTPSIFWTRWHMSLSFWIRDYVFLPLAVLRRETWWRNLALVISMILFGLWHKASVLFLLWGAYHGLLLVAHRQVQHLQRKIGWEPPAFAGTAISWITTIACISLGWILFRANSVAKAREMLTAIFSLASYRWHVLSGSLYLLVVALAAGYAIALLVAEALDRHSEETDTTGAKTHAGVAAVLAHWRWFWIPPLYTVALLFLLIVTLSRGMDTAQLMYSNF